MRKIISIEIEEARVTHGNYGTQLGSGLSGAFIFKKARGASGSLVVIASDGIGWEEIEGLPPPAWEHVSVSRKDKAPTWDDMCFVKNMFWAGDEVVIQLHPKESEYVNYHPFCLHLWKPIGIEIPIPPSITVGPKGAVR